MKLRQSLLLLCISFSFSLFASNVKSGDHVRLMEPTTENTYLAGGEVDVLASVGGDLTVAGGEIDIREVLQKDGLIIGGEIRLEALCQEDIRAFGGEILIREPIEGDLLVLGGEVNIEAGAVIGGDLIVLGGDVDVDAEVRGNVRIGGGNVELNGPVAGALEITAGELTVANKISGQSRLRASRIFLKPDALFKADVRYWQKDGEKDFAGHLTPGVKAEYDTDLKFEFADIDWDEVKDKGIFWIRLFQAVSGLLLTFVLVFLLRRFLSPRMGHGQKLAGASLLFGFVTLIGLPLLSVFAFGTVVGFPIGVVSVASFVILAVIANALAAVLLMYEGKAIRKRDWNGWTMIGIAGSIFLLMRLVAMVPFVGPTVNTILGIWAVGYLMVLLWRKNQKNMPEMTGVTPDLV